MSDNRKNVRELARKEYEVAKRDTLDGPLPRREPKPVSKMDAATYAAAKREALK